ncbi:MAG TPA: diguanylate cyclase [Bryobacteraceae bacterium]
MLSIVKTVNQLEKLEAMHRAALDSYSEVLRAAAEYPVEVDAVEAHMYQQHVQALRKMLENVLQTEDFQTIHTSFRGELRGYRDKINDWLARTRGELKAAAEAMQTLSDRVMANGSGHEARLKEDLDKLGAVARTADLGEIRAAIRQATASITASWEEMREANQFMIAQLRDEIQTLHREMDYTKRTMYTDRATGAWNRQKLESRFEELLEAGEGFVAIIIWVSNLKRLDADCSRTQINGALKAMIQRVNAIVGPQVPVGRWTEDQFVTILDVSPAAAVAFSAEVAQKLSTRYAVQEKGISHTLALRVATAVVDHPAGGEARKFNVKWEQMIGVMPA